MNRVTAACARGELVPDAAGHPSGPASSVRPPDVSSPSPWPEDLLPRALALCGALLLLAVAARLLLEPVRMVLAAADDGGRIRLVFSAPAPAPATPLPQPNDAVAPVAPPATAPEPPATTRAAPPQPGATTSAPPPVHLYGPDGGLQLPAGLQDRWTPPASAPPGSPSPAAAGSDLLRRPDPLPSRTTRFAKDWVSDGDAAEVAAQQIARAQRKIAQFLFGRDVEHARARASPEVRFNPARHARAGDLGSEATGDAYKAAPIDYEPAPGLQGEASRRIREQVAALETAYARCDRARLQALMRPLLQHLDELQKAEAALARGADPVRAEHMLPNVANGAYDMARRALWYADDRMAGCVAR